MHPTADGTRLGTFSRTIAGITTASKTQIIVALGLVLVICAALWWRYVFFVLNGGLESDLLGWTQAYWFGGIAQAYMEGASRITEGLNYANLNYPPGYPLFLALWRLFGVSNWQHIRLIQIAVDSLTCIPAYLIVRWAHSARWMALLAALGYAVMPVWASGNGLPLAEALIPALMLWFIWLLATLASRRHIWLWCAAGLMASAMAMVRYDMLLLILPVVLWALWRAPRRRTFAAGAVLLGFLIILGGWALHNREIHRQWAVSGPDGGYALWSGLGDIPNPYGYFANDARATTMLKSMGLKYGSEPAGRYFTHQYLLAWRNHPAYVLKVASYRFKQIVFPPVLFGPNTSNTYQADGVGWAQWFLFHFGLYALLLYAILNRARPHECFLVALPLLYALGSIGLVHWEERYVTYAYVTYLLAAILLAQQLIEGVKPFTERLSGRIVGGIRQKQAGAALRAIVALVLMAACAHGLARTSRDALQILHIQREIAKGDVTSLDLKDLHFTQDVANSVERQPGGVLRLVTNQSTFDYQISAKVPLFNAAGTRVDVTLTMEKGGVTVGLLSPDGSHWISQASYGAPGTYRNRYYLVKPFRSIIFVVTNNRPGEAGQSIVRLNDVHIYLVGAKPPDYLLGPEDPRSAKLQRLIADGYYTAISLGHTNLKPLAQSVQLVASGQALQVVTTKQRYGYQFGTDIDTRGIYALRIRADLVIKTGGADMGVLSADGKRFLDQVTATKTGDNRVTLTVFPGGQEHLTLVFSNYRPEDGQSVFELRSLEILLIRNQQMSPARPVAKCAGHVCSQE